MKSRIVVRRISPSVSEEGFFSILDERLGTKDETERGKWMRSRYFASGGGKRWSRAYIDFVDAEHAIAFEKVFRGFKFTDERGVSVEVSVEYAPVQQYYPAGPVVEKEPTITEDSDFKRFVQELTEDPKSRASRDKKRDDEEEIQEVPLLAMAYRNMLKKKLSIVRPSEMAATSLYNSDKLLSMKKVSGVITEEKKEKRRKKKKESKEERKARKERKKARKEKRRARREARRQKREKKMAEEAEKKKKFADAKEEQKPKKIKITKKNPQQASEAKKESKEPPKAIKLNISRKSTATAPSSSSSSSTTTTTTSSTPTITIVKPTPKEQPRKLVITRRQK